MNKCKICNIPQESKKYGRIFLTQDRYCSICNVKYKDRPRIKPLFQFKVIKEGLNNHLDSQGRKLTKLRALRNKVNKKHNCIVARVEYFKEKNKTVTRISDFL